ncbi:MAG: hypothetical protein HGA71_08220 [Azonexaceae bacterium]|nr:hypothetical protein [Azonexaceae bacterium]
MEIQALIKAGGAEWIKGEHHRVYFNNLADLAGFDADHYASSGRISGATLNGKLLSNSKAQEIESALKFGKLYFDVKAEIFMHSIPDCREIQGKDLAAAIIEEIKSRAL